LAKVRLNNKLLLRNTLVVIGEVIDSAFVVKHIAAFQEILLLAGKMENKKSIPSMVNELVTGTLLGEDLKIMMEKNEISKTERRKIVKLAKTKKIKLQSMSERQKLRMEVKEKKKLPKLSRTERLAKFRGDIEAERKSTAALFTICLFCRRKGHFVKDCPDKAMSKSEQDTHSKLLCYNCGSRSHCLRNCPESLDPTGQLPYAECFVCKQSGHLSRNCPNNQHGLYPNGGCCHICSSVFHLARNCPNKVIQETEENDASKPLIQQSDDYMQHDLSVYNEEEIETADHEEKTNKKRKKRKISES
jgi:hypothetical protein